MNRDGCSASSSSDCSSDDDDDSKTKGKNAPCSKVCWIGIIVFSLLAVGGVNLLNIFLPYRVHCHF